jgi:hypothetical protein
MQSIALRRAGCAWTDRWRVTAGTSAPVWAVYGACLDSHGIGDCGIAAQTAITLTSCTLPIIPILMVAGVDILGEGFVGSLIGALIGGSLALLGVILAWGLQLLLTWWSERNQVRAVLQAVYDEVSVLESLYMMRIGTAVELGSRHETFSLYFPISSNYFVVYDSNCGGIGRVRSPELRKSVVETYAHLKSLADTFRYNNQLLIEREQLDHQLTISPDSVALRALLAGKDDELRAYGEGIWELHHAGIAAVAKLRALIQVRLGGIGTP